MKHDQAYSEQLRRILRLAAAEARGLNHDFVGTEHLLLAIVAEGSSPAAQVLETMGADAAKVRGEIEKQVQRGPQPVQAAELPLTPRAKLALEFAAQEARLHQQDRVDAEHLLLGLLREPDGVASRVARNLGIGHREVWRQVLGVRLELMRRVERVVRPVRAGAVQKRKMREELLSHLSSLYDEEHTQLADSKAAMEAAAQRFGDPQELSRQLDAALPRRARWEHSLGKWLAWRARESAARYMARVSAFIFLVIAAGCVLILAAAVAVLGWDPAVWLAMRPGLALLVLMPSLQFVLGCSYFRMRDALWGAFGSRKSTRGVIMQMMNMFVSGACAEFLFIGLSTGIWNEAVRQLPVIGLVAIWIVVMFFWVARVQGPDEIADTIWASLDLQTD